MIELLICINGFSTYCVAMIIFHGTSRIWPLGALLSWNISWNLIILLCDPLLENSSPAVSLSPSVGSDQCDQGPDSLARDGECSEGLLRLLQMSVVRVSVSD